MERRGSHPRSAEAFGCQCQGGSAKVTTNGQRRLVCKRLLSIHSGPGPSRGGDSGMHLAPTEARDADVCTWSGGDKAQQRRQCSCGCHVGFASFTVPVNYTRLVLGTAGKFPPFVPLLHALGRLCSSWDFSARTGRDLLTDSLPQR